MIDNEEDVYNEENNTVLVKSDGPLFDDEIVDLAHHPHQTIGVEYRLGPSIVDLDLTNCRLRKIENLDHLTKLEQLKLRQNLITKLENLQSNTRLEFLDLYGNLLKNSEIDVELLNKLPRLVHLDLSFNELRHCVVGLHLDQLEELYYVNNKLKRIDEGAFDHLPKLRILELGSNRIRLIEHLDKLSALEQLWLGTNKISTIQNLSPLKSLQKLSIQCNRITRIEGLSELPNLTELYLSENGITKIEGLEHLTKLKVLDLATNKISKLENIEHLQELEEFWVNDNLLATYDELLVLQKLPKLTSLFVDRNKLQDHSQYKRKVLLMLPNLEQLDGFPVMKQQLLFLKQEQ